MGVLRSNPLEERILKSLDVYKRQDNNFSMENDTLYIEEKPLNERGEWVNGFEGSQDDYEYAMRIVRFLSLIHI